MFNKILFVTVGLVIMLSAGGIMLAAPIAQAQSCDNLTIFDNENGICVPNSEIDHSIFKNTNSLSGAITKVLNYAFALAGIIATIFVIIGGYRYLTAGGDEEATTEARSYIANALIGLVIVLAGAILVNVVAKLLTTGQL